MTIDLLLVGPETQDAWDSRRPFDTDAGEIVAIVVSEWQRAWNGARPEPPK